MSTVGIIAEYNPFHNGHGYHIRRAKELAGAEHAVVVMSGDFVQRGEPAMFDKHTRAKWALEQGADMALLLPAAFSLSSAQGFAMGGVGALHGTGIVDFLAFGSECGDIAPLKSAAKMADEESAELKELIKANLSAGLSFPDARAKAWLQHTGEETLLASPNDVLGIEYIRALNRLGSGISPVAIPRTGPGHHSAEVSGSFASASAIRERLSSGESIQGLLPDTVAGDIAALSPRTMNGLSREAVYALRCMSLEQLKALPDVSEGLENLLYSACREYGDIQSVLNAVKSKRYTMARLKRVCMCALLGLYGDPMDKLNGLYIRVLGVRKNAMQLMSELNQKASLPVISRYSDAERLNGAQRALFEADMRAAYIAPMAEAQPVGARFDFSRPLIIV